MSWKSVELDDAIEFVRNGASIKQSEGSQGLPITRIETIWNSEIDCQRFGYADISEEALAKYADYLLKDGDLLISHINSPKHLGKTAMYRGVPDKVIHGMNLLCLRPKVELLDSGYAYFYFNSIFFKAFIDRIANQSVNQASFSAGNLKAIKIPLPPLPIQKKIAAVLEKADELRRKREEQIKRLDDLLQASFLDMFGDPVTNPKGWPIKKLGNLGQLDRGKSKHRPRNAPELLGGIHPLIQTGDVANSDCYITEYSSTYSDIGLAQSKMWEAGVLCITIAANIAKTAILGINACFPDSVVGFIPGKETNVEFIHTWFSFFQQILEKNAPESAQKNINLAILRELSVVMPPVEMQSKFKDIFKRIQVDMKTKQKTDLALSTLFFNSLMQRAFKGELDLV